MYIPLRMCVGCRQMLPKNTLIRLVKSDDKIEIDKKQKLQGRGVYICPNADCIKISKKKRALERHFRTGEASGFYDVLERCLNDG